METGTHSPWVSRLLTELGHEVIVAHAQKVQLITKSNRARLWFSKETQQHSGESLYHRTIGHTGR